MSHREVTSRIVDGLRTAPEGAAVLALAEHLAAAVAQGNEDAIGAGLNVGRTTCAWAPVDHDDPAVVRLVTGWPCGHAHPQQDSPVPTCERHLLDAIKGPGHAKRGTECPTCHEVAPRVFVHALPQDDGTGIDQAHRECDEVGVDLLARAEAAEAGNRELRAEVERWKAVARGNSDECNHALADLAAARAEVERRGEQVADLEARLGIMADRVDDRDALLTDAQGEIETYRNAARAALADLRNMADEWEHKAGPDSEAARVFGEQKVSVAFVVAEIRRLTGALAPSVPTEGGQDRG